MLKPTQLSIAFETSKIEKAHKLIDSLLQKIKDYNKEVAKSNNLLREQEKLRKSLGVTVKNGKVIGLIKKDGNDGATDEGTKTN